MEAAAIGSGSCFGSGPGESYTAEMLSHFEKPKIEYVVESIFQERIHPQTPIEDSTRRIEFLLTPSPFFTDLSETILALEARLLLENGNAVPAATPAPAPPALSSMISSPIQRGFSEASSNQRGSKQQQQQQQQQQQRQPPPPPANAEYLAAGFCQNPQSSLFKGKKERQKERKKEEIGGS